jgi:hypothetical protein
LFWSKVKSKISGMTAKSKIQAKTATGKGLVIFRVVEDAIKAEKVIKESGYICKLVAPPPHLRKGCDLSLEIELVEQPVIERLLTSKVPYLGISPLKGTTELLQIEKVTYFDNYTMVKAGNMKITFENSTGKIANTSGGGCPDIPYLNIQLVGKRLNEATHPKEIGFTLCSLMLGRALDKALSLWEGGILDAADRRNCSCSRSAIN